MRNFTRISLGLAGATVLAGSIVLPASAADSTAVAANVAAGEVSIDVPDTASLNFGPVTPGTAPQLQLADVTVTDERAGTAAWGATVQISAFTADGTQPVDGFTLGYTPTTFTGTSGEIGASTPTAVASVTADAAEVQRPASVVGNNGASWDASVVLNVPSNALKGSYSTTLTHSVL